MRRLFSLLSVVLLVALLFAVFSLRGILPADTHRLVEKKYDGWSGVLRLWVCSEGLPGTAGLSAWLNRCIAGFEKRHDGVYIQPRSVDANAIAAMFESGILPPDMVLIPAGLFSGADGFIALDASSSIRPGLSAAGMWNGKNHALPVALGGYVWAYDRGVLSGIPESWEDTDARPACPQLDGRQWGAALLALCASLHPKTAERDSSENAAPGELDLGLIGTAAPIPAPAPAVRAPLPCRLPADFTFSATAFRDFCNGAVAAVPVTQGEIRRLQALSDQGKGPDWQLAATGEPFADQLAAIAVVENAASTDREHLSAAFALFLLEDACQAELHRSGAFSVTSAFSGYGAGDPLMTVENALRRDGLVVPPVFGRAWKDKTADIVRKFVSGEGEPAELWRQFASMLRN